MKRYLLTAAALSASSFVMAAPASAVVYYNSPTPTSSTFGDTDTPNGAFSQDFVINAPGTGYTLSFQIGSAANQTNAWFESLYVNFNGTIYTVPITGQSGSSRSRSLSVLGIPIGLTNTLTVYGTARTRSAYTGNLQISAAPVPEPTSWALMIGGFALEIGRASCRDRV